MKKIVKVLKENNEDFEWYPTKNEIIKRLFKDLRNNNSHYSILDIGAGNGKVLNKLEEYGKEPDKHNNTISFKKYAIEKSKILVNEMDKSIFIIGSNFYEQTLIDKNIDLIFCNPPYSEFELWAIKIIKEANSKIIYLVLPERWVNNKEIEQVIKQRKAKYKILGKFDFLDAEDRPARAKVNLIKIKLENDYRYGNSDLYTDPFDIWFNTSFKFQAQQKKEYDYTTESNNRDHLKSIIKKDNLINELVTLYDSDFKLLIDNYKSIEKLDQSIFKELKIDLNSIKESLKLRISGLKNLYWKELFDNLDKITEKLTTKSRENLLGTLIENTNIDFSENNIYCIVIWSIKNANEYYDKQLKDFYLTLADKQNIINYKSNKRIIEDDWRYVKSDNSHYSLDYRIIINKYNFIELGYDGENRGINRDSIFFIQDIFTIARNLNIDVEYFNHKDYIWEYGKQQTFFYKDTNEIFMELRPYKKGTVHIKFNQKFIKKLNIEAARLNNWIKSPSEAVNEFDITTEEANNMYKTNFKILSGNDILKLL